MPSLQTFHPKCLGASTVEVKCRSVKEVFYERCELCRLLLFHSIEEASNKGGRAHNLMVSKIQWKLFQLATQLYPQNDWAEWHVWTYEHRPHWSATFAVNECAWCACGCVKMKRERERESVCVCVSVNLTSQKTSCVCKYLLIVCRCANHECFSRCSPECPEDEANVTKAE